MTAPTKGTSARPCVSVPRALLDAYRAAELAGQAPPLSTLLQGAVRSHLRRIGVRVPDAPPTRTAAATAARWHRKAPR